MLPSDTATLGNHGKHSNPPLLPLVKQLDEISNLPLPYQRALALAAQLARKRAGEVVVAPGAKEVAVLFLVQGAITVRRHGKAIVFKADSAPLPRAIFTPGDSVDIIADRESVLLRIPQDVYTKQLSLGATAKIQETSEVKDHDDWNELDGLERALSFGVLSHLPVANVHSIVSRLEEIDFAAGEIVFEQGDHADYFYIVKTGTAEVCRLTANDTTSRLAIKVAGDAFGDEALVTSGVRSATLRMLTPGKLMRLSYEDFEAFIHQPLRRPVTLEAAHALVAEGARWLDLRDPAFFARESLPNAINIPQAILRHRRTALDVNATYVVYSDDLTAAELGCYLLAEQGLTVYFLAEFVPHFAPLALSPAAPTMIPMTVLDLPVLDDSTPDLSGIPDAPEMSTALVKQVIEAERRRFDSLLAQRTAELKEAAERQLNAKLAATDQRLRARVLNKLAEVKHQQEALLLEARKLQASWQELETQRIAFEAAQTEFEAEKASLRAELSFGIAHTG
jgi:rhodanese-related sulfurtransferase